MRSQVQGWTVAFTVTVSMCLTLISLLSFYKTLITVSKLKNRATSVAITADLTCRSLFTVTDLTVERQEVSTWVGASGDQEVTRLVRHLQHLRDSLSGVTTAHYRTLASLLPSLLTFHHHSVSSEPDEVQNLTLAGISRISAAGGVLPYVSCTILPYDDPTSFTACLRKRLGRQDSFSIEFMGDSKIRNLFYAFLERTDAELHYEIKLPNTTVPYTDLMIKYTKLKLSMYVRTRVVADFRINYRFSRFDEVEVNRVRSSTGVQQLARWAEGREEPPHLLIIGYTMWLLAKLDHNYVSDALEYLTGAHQVIAPLLDQVSQRTLVLVLPQSRYREDSRWGKFSYYHTHFRDAEIDWGEMAFLYYSQKERQQNLPETLWAGASKASYHPPHPGRARAGLDEAKDHLVAGDSGGGVWWWDTSLPLNLAAISECHQLHQRGLKSHPLYLSNFLRCWDDIHAGTITLGDQTTMLLNLVCNSVLGSPQSACCH